MGKLWAVLAVAVTLLLATAPRPQAQDVFVGFYDQSCPSAESIVTDTVRQAVAQDPTIAAGLVRLVFHDCFVEGCDGSILLDATPDNPNVEKLASPNLSVRGYEVIDQAKQRLEAACPQVVSCADIVALAARDASVLAGLNFQGLPLAMATGRWDGRTSSTQEANAALPSSHSTAEELISIFGAKGLSQDDMIALSGAHTIGRAHCVNFMDRLYNFPGSPNGVDPTLDAAYAAQLQLQCPAGNPNPDTLVNLDPVTPLVMDNQYYRNGFAGKVLFTSDRNLFVDFQTQFTSNLNSINGVAWNQKFGDALANMASIDLKDEYSGEVRLNCRSVN